MSARRDDSPRHSPTATAIGRGGVTDPPSASVRVPSGPALDIPAGPYTPGQSYFGGNNYIEYVAGNAPVI